MLEHLEAHVEAHRISDEGELLCAAYDLASQMLRVGAQHRPKASAVLHHDFCQLRVGPDTSDLAEFPTYKAVDLPPTASVAIAGVRGEAHVSSDESASGPAKVCWWATCSSVYWYLSLSAVLFSQILSPVVAGITKTADSPNVSESESAFVVSSSSQTEQVSSSVNKSVRMITTILHSCLRFFSRHMLHVPHACTVQEVCDHLTAQRGGSDRAGDCQHDGRKSCPVIVLCDDDDDTSADAINGRHLHQSCSIALPVNLPPFIDHENVPRGNAVPSGHPSKQLGHDQMRMKQQPLTASHRMHINTSSKR